MLEALQSIQCVKYMFDTCFEFVDCKNLFSTLRCAWKCGTMSKIAYGFICLHLVLPIDFGFEV